MHVMIDQLPSQDLVGWVMDNRYQMEEGREIVDEDEDNEITNLPTYMFLNVEIKGKQIKLGLDTGSVKTLISEELFNEINYDSEYQLLQNESRFEAVNGSRIECLGYVSIPVIFYGFERNYRAKIKFYIIRNLGLQGLLGIDQIYKHQLNINLADNKCWQMKTGELSMEINYREDRSVRRVVVAEDVILPPKTTCDIRVRLTGVSEEEGGEGIISPQGNLSRWGLNGARVLTTAQPQVVTQIMNTSDQSVGLWEGEDYGSFEYTEGTPFLISSIQEEFRECLVGDEELSETMLFEDMESRKMEEMDFGLSDSGLSEERKAEVREELNNFKIVFQWENTRVGFTHKMKHRIQLKPNAIPIKHKNRVFSPEQNDLIDSEVNKLLEQDIVEKSNSNWSSRIVLSWEPRKMRYRMCIDYRAVNALSVPPLAHPLPNIEEILNQFKGNSFFHVLDLFQGYHQVALEEDSKPLTAFSTRKGLFQYKRMPFGLNSCPTTYQALMEDILGSMVWKTAIVYIDDVIIFGHTYQEAYDRLVEVLEKLRAAKMRLRASKCRFFQPKVEFLGFIVSQDGIHTCKHIVDAVLNFPQPRSVKDVQRFLGVSNYYRSFIKSHSQILEPIIKLTRKRNQFVWSPSCQEAFEAIKSKLITPPIRNYYDPDLPVVLTTDASGRGIGATLNQVTSDGRLLLLSYGSKVLKPSEITWSVTEKELYAMTFFCKKFRQFLSKPFIILSDHGALRYVNSLRDSSHKLARWLNFLMQYNFEVFHRPGNSKDMLIADILSRIMVDTKLNESEALALKMERPLLKLKKGTYSPILIEWFKVEPPQVQDFEEEVGSVESGGDEGKPEVGRGSHLRLKLKRLQKEVDREVVDQNDCRWVSENEVEYLN